MYCGQCGKKVMENMLFCPFCGSPIVIPEQDEEPSAGAFEVETHEREAAAAGEEEQISGQEPLQNEAPQCEVKRPMSLFDDFDFPEPETESRAAEDQKAFVPLSFDFAGESSADVQNGEAEANSPVDIVPDPIPGPQSGEAPSERPARRNAPKLMRPEGASRRAANTYILIREIDPEDMFMDGFGDESDYDDYDSDDDDRSSARDYGYDDTDEDDFEFEEPESGSFFQRHIRGIVGLLLLLIVAAICMIWAFSGKGQLTLAQMNLAWTAQPYADLGYSAYQQGSALQAARYYEKALARESSNYEYAHSAMVAYYEAGETQSAAAMLKKCIELDPDNPEPYMEMLILYPDAQTRPWDVTELVRQGYQRTGNEALKLD